MEPTKEDADDSGSREASPEGSLTINGGAPAVGRDALTAVAASFYEALPDMQVLFDDLVVDGDRIEFHRTFTGTNTGRAAPATRCG